MIMMVMAMVMAMVIMIMMLMAMVKDSTNLTCTHSAQVAVTPGMTEGMAGHKTAGAACGCVGTVSWKIGDTNRKLVVMYSVPFNHDYYSNVCAAGIFALNATIDFDMMYYKSENGFKRKDFWKDLTALTYDKDSMFVVTASMGSNHRPHIKVQLKAKSL